jgi:hypothetical protein
MWCLSWEEDKVRFAGTNQFGTHEVQLLRYQWAGMQGQSTKEGEDEGESDQTAAP